MGSVFGLKILSIENCNAIKEINKNSQDKRILPFIHYITKLNGISIDNFSKKNKVNSISAINIITKETSEFNIKDILCSELLENAEYEFKEIPEIQQVLMVCLVQENSMSAEFGIVKDKTILVGSKDKYFSEIDDVSISIAGGNKQFIFYNFEKEELNIFDFSTNDSNKSFGFQVQEVRMDYFYSFFFKPTKEKLKADKWTNSMENNQENKDNIVNKENSTKDSDKNEGKEKPSIDKEDKNISSGNTIQEEEKLDNDEEIKKEDKEEEIKEDKIKEINKEEINKEEETKKEENIKEEDKPSEKIEKVNKDNGKEEEEEEDEEYEEEEEEEVEDLKVKEKYNKEPEIMNKLDENFNYKNDKAEEDNKEDDVKNMIEKVKQYEQNYTKEEEEKHDLTVADMIENSNIINI